MALGGEGVAVPSSHPPTPRLVGTLQSQCWMCRGEGGYAGSILVLRAPGPMAETHFVGGRSGRHPVSPSQCHRGGHIMRLTPCELTLALQKHQP